MKKSVITNALAICVIGIMMVACNKPVTSISLDKSSVLLNEGENATLVSTVLPENATDPSVTWTSSDGSVATVTAGVVRAVSKGEATITATAGEFSATCKVTVYRPVSGITLDQSAVQLAAGNQIQLEATIAPADPNEPAYTWSTSDAKVATVDNGVVKGVSAGRAVITVTTKEGNFTATCTVDVQSVGFQPPFTTEEQW